MASNPRKRRADSRSISRASKTPRNSDPDVAPPVPEHSRRITLESQIRTPPHGSQAPATPWSLQQEIKSKSPGGSANATPKSTPSRVLQPSSRSRRLVPESVSNASPAESAHASRSVEQPIVYKPAVLHRPHPDSKLCQDFHWVPYPLGLMPYDSWYHLHHREDIQPLLPFRCPVCRVERKATAHTRKVFLVAERLTWEEGLTSTHEKDLNEELNWKFNYDLGILDPFVEAEPVLGGKNSRSNKFYPYQNEHEMKLALKLIFMTENITETTWALWIGTQLDLENMLNGHEGSDAVSIASESIAQEQNHPQPKSGDPTRPKTPEIDMIDLTVSPDRASRLPTPPSSFKVCNVGTNIAKVVGHGESPHPLSPSTTPSTGPSAKPTCFGDAKRIKSYKSLQDFYSLLDRIERTSYVGALFLEAYAERLRDDMCKDCWFAHYVNLDEF